MNEDTALVRSESQSQSRFGLIKMSHRTYCVCSQSGLTSHSLSVGFAFYNYRLETKPLAYVFALAALRELSKGHPIDEAWLPKL